LVGPSRFVRGLVPGRMGAPMTVGCSLGAEEGNVVSVRIKANAPDARGEKKPNAIQGTRPSLGPKARARQSSLHFGRRKSNEGGAVLGASRLGKPTEVGGTNTGVSGNRTKNARLAAVHRSRKGCSVNRRRKGRRLRPPSLRGNESSGECSYVVSSCRNHQASSGLEYASCSAPKRVATQVNRDLARSHRRP
jgi:hypothetical protein